MIDTAAPVFGPADSRDLFFSEPLPTKFRVGSTAILRGRLTAQDAVDFDEILFSFIRADGTRIRFSGSVNRTRDFAVTVRFGESDRGPYSLSAYLFWPTSGTQLPRSTLSTFTVE